MLIVLQETQTQKKSKQIHFKDYSDSQIRFQELQFKAYDERDLEEIETADALDRFKKLHHFDEEKKLKMQADLYEPQDTELFEVSESINFDLSVSQMQISDKINPQTCLIASTFHSKVAAGILY